MELSSLYKYSTKLNTDGVHCRRIIVIVICYYMHMYTTMNRVLRVLGSSEKLKVRG